MAFNDNHIKLNTRTPLEQQRVSAGYRDRLEQAALDFTDWCTQRRLPLKTAWKDGAEMSNLLVHYVQLCKDGGQPDFGYIVDQQL